MSKLKIEHGASKVRLVLLKTNIEDGISADIDLMCQWSENDRKYIINELLRFALTQDEDFLKYKAGLQRTHRGLPTPRSQHQNQTPIQPVMRDEGVLCMRVALHFQNLSRPLIEYRLLLSLGLSAACGIVLQSLYPVHDADPLLRLLALERPAIFHGLLWSYNLFLYSTPFLVFSILFSLAYIHFYDPKSDQVAGALPPYPDPLPARRPIYGAWRGPPAVEAEALSCSELALHLGARSVYGYLRGRGNRQWKDPGPDSSGPAPAFRISCQWTRNNDYRVWCWRSKATSAVRCERY